MTADGLIFRWAPPRPRKRAIISFVIASIVLHALAFYIFQIVYPPPVTLLPAPARVSVISPMTEEGRLLLRWVEAEDPALGSMTLRPPDAKTFQPPKVAHVPSFASYEPKLRELPPYVPDLRPPDPMPPQPVPQRRAPAPQPLPPSKTALTFSNEVATLGPVQTPQMQFTRSIKESPQAAELRVAVSRSGEVRYAFLETSSGDSALDEQARQYVANCRFSGTAGNTNDLIWTTAAIVWGSDVAAPKEP
jgi:TonB family protein